MKKKRGGIREFFVVGKHPTKKVVEIYLEGKEGFQLIIAVAKIVFAHLMVYVTTVAVVAFMVLLTKLSLTIFDQVERIGQIILFPVIVYTLLGTMILLMKLMAKLVIRKRVHFEFAWGLQYTMRILVIATIVMLIVVGIYY